MADSRSRIGLNHPVKEGFVYQKYVPEEDGSQEESDDEIQVLGFVKKEEPKAPVIPEAMTTAEPLDWVDMIMIEVGMKPMPKMHKIVPPELSLKVSELEQLEVKKPQESNRDVIETENTTKVPRNETVTQAESSDKDIPADDPSPTSPKIDDDETDVETDEGTDIDEGPKDQLILKDFTIDLPLLKISDSAAIYALKRGLNLFRDRSKFPKFPLPITSIPESEFFFRRKWIKKFKPTYRDEGDDLTASCQQSNHNQGEKREYPEECSTQISESSDHKKIKASTVAEETSLDSVELNEGSSIAVISEKKRVDGIKVPRFDDPKQVYDWVLRFVKRRKVIHKYDQYIRFKGINQECPDCHNTFQQKSTLLSHAPCFWKKENKGRPKDFLCNFCGIVFSTLGRLREHMDFHLDPQFDCLFPDASTGRICGKTSYRKEKARRHVRIHFNSSTARCLWPACRKRFSCLLSTQKHIVNEHLELKPFSCNQCHYKCVGFHQLKRHLKTHLDQSQRKGLECPDGNCSKSYYDAKEMRNHIKKKHPILYGEIKDHLRAESKKDKKSRQGQD